MKNARPRFALTPEGMLYDYLTSSYREAVGFLEDGWGVWDLPKVAALIQADDGIEAAFSPKNATAEIAKLQQDCALLQAFHDEVNPQLSRLDALEKEKAHLEALLTAAQAVAPPTSGTTEVSAPISDPFSEPVAATPEPTKA